jgi:hypothetical protein
MLVSWDGFDADITLGLVFDFFRRFDFEAGIFFWREALKVKT